MIKCWGNQGKAQFSAVKLHAPLPGQRHDDRSNVVPNYHGAWSWSDMGYLNRFVGAVSAYGWADVFSGYCNRQGVCAGLRLGNSWSVFCMIQGTKVKCELACLPRLRLWSVSK